MAFERTGTVTGSMCDVSTKLSMIAVFQLIEDAATDLMGDLHIDGITAMREYGAMWVFAKNIIHVFQRPSWREGYVIRSFVSGYSSVKLNIDTEILTREGLVPIVHSRLELCALDLKTGRIRRSQTMGIQSDTPCEQPLPELSYTRFPTEDTEKQDTVCVKATNLDYCSHTNNIEYIRFIFNTYRAKELADRDVEQVEVHYGQQTFEGDVLSVMMHSIGDEDFFSIQSGEEVAAECRIKWRKQIR